MPAPQPRRPNQSESSHLSRHQRLDRRSWRISFKSVARLAHHVGAGAEAGAIGRKNRLFAGNDRAGQTAAMLYSLIASAERHGVDPQRYAHERPGQPPEHAGRRTTQVQDVASKDAYTYDAADRLTSIDHRTSGGTTRASYDYTLDAAGRLTSEARTWNTGASTDTVTYGYTDDDQLTSVAHTNGSFAGESFSYDDNGNRDSSGYATKSGNRISTDGTCTYAYDAEANQISRTEFGGRPAAGCRCGSSAASTGSASRRSMSGGGCSWSGTPGNRRPLRRSSR
jgi:YD repeat-containing protein